MCVKYLIITSDLDIWSAMLIQIFSQDLSESRRLRVQQIDEQLGTEGAHNHQGQHNKQQRQTDNIYPHRITRGDITGGMHNWNWNTETGETESTEEYLLLK